LEICAEPPSAFVRVARHEVCQRRDPTRRHRVPCGLGENLLRARPARLHKHVDVRPHRAGLASSPAVSDVPRCRQRIRLVAPASGALVRGSQDPPLSDPPREHAKREIGSLETTRSTGSPVQRGGPHARRGRALRRAPCGPRLRVPRIRVSWQRRRRWVSGRGARESGPRPRILFAAGPRDARRRPRLPAGGRSRLPPGGRPGVLSRCRAQPAMSPRLLLVDRWSAVLPLLTKLIAILNVARPRWDPAASTVRRQIWKKANLRERKRGGEGASVHRKDNHADGLQRSSPHGAHRQGMV
jgi:hypothetical protein